MISEKKIKTEKTARYFQLGSLSNKTKNIWFVFHGYGQLAGEFILNFSKLANDETLIVAPEALNKFYLRGFTGKIGATWMTTECRLNEIDDYVNMINNVYNQISNFVDYETVTFNVFGFSQGSHTAVRWLNKTKIRTCNLLLWSGTFPHDCNYIENSEYWLKVNTKIFFGNSDRLISEEHFNNELKFIKEQEVRFELLRFEGGHKIDIDKLLSIINTL